METWIRGAFALTALSFGIAAVACGSDTELTGFTGSADGVGGVATGGTGGANAGGGGEAIVPPIECTSEPGDTAAHCQGLDPCPITVDRIVSCDGPVRDLFVLATPNDVLLGGVAEERQLRAWAVTQDDLEAMPGLPSLSYDNPSARVDLQGTAHVLAQTLPAGERGTDYDARLFRRDAGGFASVEVPNRKLRSFRVDPAGELHFWGRSQGGEDQHHWGTPASGYQVEPLVSPHDIANPLPDLAADGTPIAYAAADIASAFRLYVRVDDTNRELGADMGSGYDPFTPFGQATPAPAAGASRYGAVLFREQGLTAAWAGTAGWGEVPIPETNPYDEPCSGACPQDCTLDFRAVHRKNYVPARASSGALWLPHLITNVDARLRYEIDDNPSGCRVDTVSDDSTYELVLSRVLLDGSPAQTMLRVPTITTTSFAAGSSSPALWAHAYADDLAIALFLLSDDGLRLRVLRIDTTLLVPEL
ncbi:MAG: hypothetical protein AAF715_14290 [Myxococcota bacterium]